MRFRDSLRGASRRAVLVAVSLAITLAMAGIDSGAAVASARAPRPAGSGAHLRNAARLAVVGGALPAAAVGKRYSYRFRVASGGTASWAPLTELPLGLALDPVTGVLSGVPEEAGTQGLVVSAARGGAHPAIGSASATL